MQLTTLYDDDDLLKCFIRLFDWMSMQYLLAKSNWPILYCMFLLSIYLNLNSLYVFAIYLSKFSQTLCFITYLVSRGHEMFWQTIKEIKCQIFCRGCESFSVLKVDGFDKSKRIKQFYFKTQKSIPLLKM